MDPNYQNEESENGTKDNERNKDNKKDNEINKDSKKDKEKNKESINDKEVNKDGRKDNETNKESIKDKEVNKGNINNEKPNNGADLFKNTVMKYINGNPEDEISIEYDIYNTPQSSINGKVSDNSSQSNQHLGMVPEKESSNQSADTDSNEITINITNSGNIEIFGDITLLTNLHYSEPPAQNNPESAVQNNLEPAVQNNLGLTVQNNLGSAVQNNLGSAVQNNDVHITQTDESMSRVSEKYTILSNAEASSAQFYVDEDIQERQSIVSKTKSNNPSESTSQTQSTEIIEHIYMAFNHNKSAPPSKTHQTRSSPISEENEFLSLFSTDDEQQTNVGLTKHSSVHTVDSSESKHIVPSIIEPSSVILDQSKSLSPSITEAVHRLSAIGVNGEYIIGSSPKDTSAHTWDSWETKRTNPSESMSRAPSIEGIDHTYGLLDHNSPFSPNIKSPTINEESDFVSPVNLDQSTSVKTRSTNPSQLTPQTTTTEILERIFSIIDQSKPPSPIKTQIRLPNIKSSIKEETDLVPSIHLNDEQSFREEKQLREKTKSTNPSELTSRTTSSERIEHIFALFDHKLSSSRTLQERLSNTIASLIDNEAGVSSSGNMNNDQTIEEEKQSRNEKTHSTNASGSTNYTDEPIEEEKKSKSVNNENVDEQSRIEKIKHTKRASRSLDDDQQSTEEDKQSITSKTKDKKKAPISIDDDQQSTEEDKQSTTSKTKDKKRASISIDDDQQSIEEDKQSRTSKTKGKKRASISLDDDQQSIEEDKQSRTSKTKGKKRASISLDDDQQSIEEDKQSRTSKTKGKKRASISLDSDQQSIEEDKQSRTSKTKGKKRASISLDEEQQSIEAEKESRSGKTKPGIEVVEFLSSVTVNNDQPIKRTNPDKSTTSETSSTELPHYVTKAKPPSASRPQRVNAIKRMTNEETDFLSSISIDEQDLPQEASEHSWETWDSIFLLNDSDKGSSVGLPSKSSNYYPMSFTTTNVNTEPHTHGKHRSYDVFRKPSDTSMSTPGSQYRSVPPTPKSQASLTDVVTQSGEIKEKYKSKPIIHFTSIENFDIDDKPKRASIYSLESLDETDSISSQIMYIPEKKQPLSEIIYNQEKDEQPSNQVIYNRENDEQPSNQVIYNREKDEEPSNQVIYNREKDEQPSNQVIYNREKDEQPSNQEKDEQPSNQVIYNQEKDEQPSNQVIYNQKKEQVCNQIIHNEDIAINLSKSSGHWSPFKPLVQGVNEPQPTPEIQSNIDIHEFTESQVKPSLSYDFLKQPFVSGDNNPQEQNISCLVDDADYDIQIQPITSNSNPRNDSYIHMLRHGIKISSSYDNVNELDISPYFKKESTLEEETITERESIKEAMLVTKSDKETETENIYVNSSVKLGELGLLMPPNVMEAVGGHENDSNQQQHKLNRKCVCLDKTKCQLVNRIMRKKSSC